jgi:hippurate hydrolase
MKTTALLFAALAATLPVFAQASELDVSAAKARIDAILDKSYDGLERIYKDIHAHPEVAFQETRTASLLAEKMRKLGFEVTEKVGKTGIVAIFRNGSGPTVLIRTELDALPMEEKTGLPYASRAKQIVDGEESFVAHSCGHDVHMAWWVGTAQTLLALRDQWHGTLMFIGQPAEERVVGAKAMLDDGLFTRFPKPDYGFAAHVTNQPVGIVVVKAGTATSAADTVEVIFHGRGGHGSMPSATIDPIVIGAHFVSDVQTIISREKDAGAFGVITVGSFQAGSVPNIIPDRAILKLTLRSFSPEVRKLLLDGVARTAKAAADMARAPAPEIKHLEGVGSTVNDDDLARRAGSVMRAAIGNNAILQPASAPGVSASEDYSEFVRAGVPSVFYFIGSYDPKVIAGYKSRGEPVPVNHSPFFAPEPSSIRTGVMTLTLSVLMVAGR